MLLFTFKQTMNGASITVRTVLHKYRNSISFEFQVDLITQSSIECEHARTK